MSADDMPLGGEVPPWDRAPVGKEDRMSIHMVTWPEQVEYLEAEIRLRDKRISELEERVCRYLEAEAAALEADSATVCKTRAAKELLFFEAQVLRRYADKLRAGKHHEEEGGSDGS